MNIIIIISSDVARVFHQHEPPTKGSDQISKVLKELNVALKPLHPSTNDPDLMKYFFIEVSDFNNINLVQKRLELLEAIESIYTKPFDEEP